MGDRVTAIDTPQEDKPVDRTPERPEAPESNEQTLSTSNQESPSSASDGFANRTKSLSETLLNNGLMPAMSESEVPATLAQAATLFDGQSIGVAADVGRSSGSSVSALLKVSGSDITPTMDIGNLHGQLTKAGWTSSEYKPGDALKNGDLLFTSLERSGRNVGVVGSDGKIYSHNMRSNQFEGRDNWSSKFVTVMRAPGSDKK